ncbi:MAG: phage holin family protein [bacterium]|nr:phage holin family protein [bacterium]
MILLIKWVALALTVMFAGWLVPGVIIEDFKTAMIAAIAIAVINLVIRPVIMLFALPFNILTLGLFTLVINALLFMFVAYVVPGVEVDGFMSALLGSLVISILSIGISWL